jgi:hypothetical protein
MVGLKRLAKPLELRRGPKLRQGTIDYRARTSGPDDQSRDRRDESQEMSAILLEKKHPECHTICLLVHMGTIGARTACFNERILDWR